MKKIHVTIAVALLAVVAALWMYQRADASEPPAYRYAPITRGNLQSTVSATGTLNAVTTVQVGTQVSGQVAAIYVDFNDRVKKGQLLARIDPTLAQQAVQDAEAGVERVQAQLTQAKQEYDREKQLFDAKIITASEFNTAQSNYAVAQANLKSAAISLDRARQNLSYTSILAPIDGVVVERNVDVGQTVAASLSAPQIFLIANDLSQMQILASVDESDIGLIKTGQPVNFTVQAYPTRTFTGTVKQVRLQSTTQDNVVNYTAVITVQNADGALLPGMTATVSFLTGSVSDALLVPNAALRVKPTPEMLASLGANRPQGSRAATAGVQGDSARGAALQVAGTRTTPARSDSAGASRPAMALLWYAGKDGKVTGTRVRTGFTDGQHTAVVGAGLSAGTQVVIGVTQPGTATAASGAAPAAGSPFQTQTRGGRRPGGF